MMNESLAGRVVVVTGASRGLGAVISQRLAAEDAVVVRLARTLSERVESRRVDLPCDVTDETQVTATANRILAEVGVPAVVVSNAGAFVTAPLETTTTAQFDQLLTVNLRANFLVARAFLPAMRQTGGGRFIAIGSVADRVAFPGNAAYAASKFGLRGLHEVLRVECKGTGVHATLLSPGSMDTAVWDPIDPDNQPGFLPRRKMLHPGDVAEAVVFIATRPPHVEIESLRINPAFRS